MHPNPAYRQTGDADNIAFARARGFGTLAVNGAQAPLLSHVPFWLAEDGSVADLHLVRSNPIARQQDPIAAVLSVMGPDAYVSPDWYGMPDQVPTWNYVAVHLRGSLTRLPADRLRAQLDALSDRFEAELTAKPPWRTEKMAPEAMARMMRQILPFRLQITEVQGTWKLGQNKPDAARLSAADGVAAATPGQETTDLARLMRQAGSDSA